MSKHLDPSSNLLNKQTIQEIDNLDVTILQKHHVRILAHCLNIIKDINTSEDSGLCDKKLLREWCDNQSRKFDDRKFS